MLVSYVFQIWKDKKLCYENIFSGKDKLVKQQAWLTKVHLTLINDRPAD